jgi:hypothetical protein
VHNFIIITKLKKKPNKVTHKIEINVATVPVLLGSVRFGLGLVPNLGNHLVLVGFWFM